MLYNGLEWSVLKCFNRFGVSFDLILLMNYINLADKSSDESLKIESELILNAFMWAGGMVATIQFSLRL